MSLAVVVNVVVMDSIFPKWRFEDMAAGSRLLPGRLRLIRYFLAEIRSSLATYQRRNLRWGAHCLYVRKSIFIAWDGRPALQQRYRGTACGRRHPYRCAKR
jgi:hypothetical protein